MVLEKSLNGKCGGGCVATTLLICSTCSLLPYKVELLFHIIEKGTASECKMEIQKSLQLPDKTHFFFFNFFIVVGFVIYGNESAMGLHVFPIPIPPPTSLSTRSLQV